MLIQLRLELLWVSKDIGHSVDSSSEKYCSPNYVLMAPDILMLPKTNLLLIKVVVQQSYQ